MIWATNCLANEFQFISCLRENATLQASKFYLTTKTLYAHVVVKLNYKLLVLLSVMSKRNNINTLRDVNDNCSLRSFPTLTSLVNVNTRGLF